MHKKRHYSKKSPVVGIVIWSVILLPIIYLFLTKTFYFHTFVLLWLGAAFISWFWFGTYYDISGDELTYRSGPLKGKVSISEINRVKKNSNSLSHHGALSMDRIEIFYGNSGKSIILSPRNKDLFIADLREINEKIEME
jgi:hypothetical protein